MNEIEEIENWYHRQCNGDWEHWWGVKIDTLDNPGWSVIIQITGTKLESVPFAEVREGVGPDSGPVQDDWFICKVDEGEFKGFGSPHRLKTILRVFLDWQGQQEESPRQP